MRGVLPSPKPENVCIQDFPSINIRDCQQAAGLQNST